MTALISSVDYVSKNPKKAANTFCCHSSQAEKFLSNKKSFKMDILPQLHNPWTESGTKPSGSISPLTSPVDL